MRRILMFFFGGLAIWLLRDCFQVHEDSHQRQRERIALLHDTIEDQRKTIRGLNAALAANDWVDASDVAEILGVSRRTVFRMANRGELPPQVRTEIPRRGWLRTMILNRPDPASSHYE